MNLLRAVSLPIDARHSYSLRLWDTGQVKQGQTMLGYELRGPNGAVLFTGEDYRAGASVAIDSDEAVRGILGCLCLRPGDTDDEHFEKYTPEQRAFAEGDAETLQLFTLDEDPLPFETPPPFGYRVLPEGGFEVWRNGDTENDPRNLHDAGDLLEALGLIGNGYDAVAPEWIGALTDDPWLFTDDLETADDGTHTVSGKLWYWPDYQIRSPMEVLACDGKVIFPLVPKND